MTEGDSHAAADHGAAAGEGARGGDGEEIEKLRREVESLRKRSARRPARTIPAVILIIVACVLAPLSVVSVWAADIVGNTDRYVATVQPLASNPDVQAAVTDRVTTLVIQQADVTAQVQSLISALESRGLSGTAASTLSGLSGPIEDGVTGFIHNTVAGVVASPVFATIWTNLNQQAHSSVVKALSGEGGGAVQLNGNSVSIDLAPVIEQVKAQLVAAGLGIAAHIPIVHTNFTVFSSDTIPKVKTGFRLLQSFGNWLPVFTVLIGAAGVLLALRRRTALIGMAIGIAVGMIILGIGLTVGRTLTLQQLPPGTSAPAATAVIDAVLHFLRVTIRTLGILAVVVALGAYLSGPASFAVSVRRYCIGAVGMMRGLFDRTGLGLGPATRFVHGARTWLTWAILLIVALIFLLWDHPTVAVVVWTTVIVLAALAVLEFLDPSALPHRTGEDDDPRAGDQRTTAPAT